MKTKKLAALKYFVTEQHVSFKLKNGKHVINIGAPALGGKEFAVYIKINSDDITSTWAIDLKCGDYCQSRTIPNDLKTSWHHVPSNTIGITSTELILNSTSNNKDEVGIVEIKIIN
jgi:hypothetical protein